MHDFYNILFTTSDGLLAVQYQLCDKINSARLRTYARNTFSKDVAMNYASLYRAIHNPENGYSNAQ